MAERERIPTHILNLDEKMEGGIPVNYVVLVCGKSGTMKSSVAYSILFNAAKKSSKTCVYLTLEQNRADLIDHMESLGFNAEAEGLGEAFTVLDLAKMRKNFPESETTDQMDWLNSIVTTIRQYKDQFDCDLVAIDSMSAIYSLADLKNPRAQLFHFFEKIRDIKVTTLLITEMYSTDSFGLYGVEDFLSDGILHLDMERNDRVVNLFLAIAKMRRTKHQRGYFPLIFERGQFEVVTD